MKKRFEELWLCLTTKCNASCKYCWWQKFAKNAPRYDMDRRTIDASLDFIAKNVNEGGPITFFGGEPLLKFDSIQYIMNKFPVWNYKIFTNASLLSEEMIDFFYDRRDFITIVLSLDGVPEVQKRNRGVEINYNLASKVFSKFIDSSVTMTLYDPKDLYEAIKFFVSLGVKSVRSNPPEFIELPDDYFDEVKRQKQMLAEDSQTRYIPVEVFNNKEVRRFCGCGEDKFSILSDGAIYPCDVFACFNRHKIGDVFSGIDEVAMREFIDLKKKREASGAYCSCYVNHLYHYGDIS